MTEKELLYLEDILEQSKQLQDISNYYSSEISEELCEVLEEVEETAKKQFEKVFDLL